MRTSILVLAITGCVPSSSSVTVHQRGLIPRARPATYDGQPIQGRGRVEGYAETQLETTAPGDDPDNGAVVARTRFGGAARFARTNNTDFGITFDAARSTGAVAAGESQMAVPNTNAFGAGFELRRAVPITPEWNIGISGRLAAWSVPIEADNGGDDANWAPELSMTLVPSYRNGRVVLYGSVTAASEISVPETYVKTTTNGDSSNSKSPASLGSVVGIVGAGARIDMKPAWLGASIAYSYGSQGGDIPVVSGSLGFDIE